MNYIYSALLLHSAGKEITEENVKKVVEAAGEKADESKVKALTSALEGVDIKSVVEKAAMPVAVASAPVAQAEVKKEAGPSKEDEEKKAESAAEGLSSLFG